MTQRVDRIAQLKNCPILGESIRKAITESRKDFLLEDEDQETPAEADATAEPSVPPARGDAR